MLAHRCRLLCAFAVAASLSVSHGPAIASEGPHDVIRLCIATQPHPPYTDPNVETPIQARIRLAASSQGFGVEFIPLPWLRCIHEVHKDVLDGAVGLGDRIAGEQGMRYPLKDGVLDRRRVLGDVRFVFFRRVGDVVDWDGQRYHNLQGPVLTIGLVGEMKLDLAATGVAIEGTARGPVELASMLLAGRGNLAADSEARVLEVMAKPEFAGRLEMLAKPLGERVSMLVIAPHLYEQYPQRIEGVWDEYARLREEQENPESFKGAPSVRVHKPEPEVGHDKQ